VAENEGRSRPASGDAEGTARPNCRQFVRMRQKRLTKPPRSDGISPRSTGTWASAHSEQKTESAAEREEREQRRGCATLPRLVDCEKATWVAN